MPQYTDQMCYTVKVDTKISRIVSLVPSITELIANFGKRNQLVGITRFCTRPKEVYRNVQRVGGTKDFKIEDINKLKPDIVFANKEENEKNAILELKKTQTVWLSYIQTLAQAYDMIKSIGKILEVEKKSIALCNQLQKEFAQLKLPPTYKMPSVAYLIWRKPYMTINKSTFINDMLLQAGFKNVFADQKLRYPTIKDNQLQSANPDCVFLSSEPYPFTNTHLQELKKICPQSKIILVDGALFSWYGSRLLDSAAYFLGLRKHIN